MRSLFPSVALILGTGLGFYVAITPGEQWGLGVLGGILLATGLTLGIRQAAWDE